ncbi:MAG: carbohydrate ABC transporter permease [Anaerolineae bacterium]|nr:carbohydrate ABC transporter permease [Anaerolineae bacterium]
MSSEASRYAGLAPVAVAAVPRRRWNLWHRVNRVAVYGPLIFLTVLAVVPVIWMLFSSLKSLSEFYTNPWLWPRAWHWENYTRVWMGASFGLYFTNSMIMVTSSVSGMIIIGSLAGYALARYQFVGRDSVLYYFISGQIIPGQVVLIPLFIIVRFLGLLNTRQGLFLIYLAAAMPFVVFMMQGYFKSISREIEEAARMDGASELRIFWQIMFPLARPGIGSLAVFQSLWIWNEFLFALVFANKPHLRTLPIGIVSTIGQYFTDYPAYFAGLSVAMLPSIILYLITAKYMLRSTITGAVKG